jgi:hypothetical protein
MCVGTESAKERQRPEEMAIKKIARRFEDAKVKVSHTLPYREGLSHSCTI